MGLLSTVRFILNHPINRAHRLDALVRYLRWQTGGRLVQGQVAYDWILGLKFFLRPGDTGLTGNLYCGLHEFSSMAYVLHTLESDDLFVDVGANVGSYTLLACGGVGARGYCFEPVPETFERLVANLRLNELTERVVAMNVGIAEEEGELLFTKGEDTINHVVLPHEASKETVSVKVKRLDDILENESPSLMKVDVEGFETSVVRGGKKTLAKESLHSVIMELGGAGEKYGFSERELFDYMLSLGFRACHYHPETRTLQEMKDWFATKRGTPFVNDNALFVRDIERVRERLRKSPKISVYGTWI